MLLIFQCLTYNDRMNKVRMHAGEISYCIVCLSVRAIINSLKLVGYLRIQTLKPYSNLSIYNFTSIGLVVFLKICFEYIDDSPIGST